MQHDGCEYGRLSSGVFLAGTPKTEGHAGTMNVGTNSVKLRDSYSVHAHAEGEISIRKFGKPHFGHALSRIVESR